MRFSLFTLIIIACLTTNTFGQEIPCQEGRTALLNEKGDSIISYVEKMPFLKEGIEPYMKWFKFNIDKRLIAKKGEQKRKVYVGFVVHEDGSTSDFKIDKGQGDPYDKEAIRLIMNNPKTWVAGQCGNRKVKTRMTMPIEF
jgi:hypothetical protein